jgi:hypothetical protein
MRANVSGTYIDQPELGRRVTIDHLARIAYHLSVDVISQRRRHPV